MCILWSRVKRKEITVQLAPVSSNMRWVALKNGRVTPGAVFFCGRLVLARYCGCDANEGMLLKALGQMKKRIGYARRVSWSNLGSPNTLFFFFCVFHIRKTRHCLVSWAASSSKKIISCWWSPVLQS